MIFLPTSREFGRSHVIVPSFGSFFSQPKKQIGGIFVVSGDTLLSNASSMETSPNLADRELVIFFRFLGVFFLLKQTTT